MKSTGYGMWLVGVLLLTAWAGSAGQAAVEAAPDEEEPEQVLAEESAADPRRGGAGKWKDETLDRWRERRASWSLEERHARRFEAGTRSLRFSLQRGRKGEPFEGSFIGSINKLEEVQDNRPNRLFVQYAFVPHFGLGLQRDRLEIKTLTTIPREQRVDDRDTDGNVIMEGLLPYLFVRLASRYPCTPFMEWGMARYRNTFRPDLEWYAGGRREFILDSRSRANYWAAGMVIDITEHVAADIYFRSMDIDVPGVYHFRGDSRDPEPFVFTMKHTSCGAGVMVRF